jgi:ketosteroid isomerase-like protein
MNNTEEIAKRLAAHCSKGDFEAAQNELFSPDAVSIEMKDSPAFAKETKGLEAIRAKGRKFSGMIERIHSIRVSPLIVTGDAFACALTIDADMKGQGRTTMSEICVYEVKDGKIVAERFFN